MGDLANTTTISTASPPHWNPAYAQFVSDLQAMGRKWILDNKEALADIARQLKASQ